MKGIFNFVEIESILTTVYIDHIKYNLKFGEDEDIFFRGARELSD